MRTEPDQNPNNAGLKGAAPALSITLLTDEEVRRILRCSRKTLWRLRRRGYKPLPSVRVGGRVLYEATAIERWVGQQRGG